MDTRTTGIILRTRRLTESSLIVHWLTAHEGRIATVAKGALRPRSPFRGKLDLLFKAEFTFARSRRSELHSLREVNVIDLHTPLRRELAWLQQAAYASGFVEHVTETDTPLPEVYQLFDRLLDHLPRQPASATTILTFEMQMLDVLGLSPDFEKVSLSPGSKKILSVLRRSPWSTVARLRLSTAQVSELRRFLQGFLTDHLNTLLRGRGEAFGDVRGPSWAPSSE